VAPSSDCTLRDSAAMLSTNSQRIDTSESDPSSSSTAWSDPDVSESQAAYATLRDTSSSLLSIGPDITRQTMTSRTTICRALLFHSINCEPSRETGGCTHAYWQPSFMRSHAHARCTSMQTDNHSAIEHAHYSSLCACVWVFFSGFRLGVRACVSSSLSLSR
jgi:hypothetical protein